MLRLIERARQFQKRQEQSARATRLILERNLAEEELSEYANLYNDWSTIPEGDYIKELTFVRYKEVLYQCRRGEGHHKDEKLTPEDEGSTLRVVNPRDLIPVWESSIKYNKDDEVIYNGSVWKSVKDNPTTEPGTDNSWVPVIDTQ